MREQFGILVPDDFPKLFPKYESWELELIDKYFTGEETVIEVGCGYGVTGVTMAKKGCVVFGLDSDVHRVLEAREVIKCNSDYIKVTPQFDIGLIVSDVAAGNESEDVPFYKVNGGFKLRTLSIPFVWKYCVDHSFAGYIPNTLVMDIEGGEWAILEADIDFIIEKFTTIMMELHGNKAFSNPLIIKLMEAYTEKYRKEDVIFLRR